MVFDNVNTIMQEPRKRQTAFKLKISEMLSGNTVSSNNLNFLEINDKKITRVNIIANVIDKFVSEGEKRYAALTIDDASGQIRVKAFGEDIEKIRMVEIGDIVLVIGNPRFFNNELYILPEILKPVDSKWLVARKFELEKNKSKKISAEVAQTKTGGIEVERITSDEKQLTVKDSSLLRKQILELLKKNEEGSDIDKIIMTLHAPVEEINSTITKMLEDAEIYEPKPGRIRLL
jgi:RPA family protein